MSKINVSIVIPSLETGGAESMSYQLAKEIDTSKFNLNFICLYSSKGTIFEKNLLKAGIPITYLEKGLGLKFNTFFKLWRELKKHDTQIVHTHLGACLYASPWSFFNKKKLIHTIHTIPSKELPFLHQVILKKMYKKNKAVPVAISDNISKQTSEFYKLKNDLIEVIYNPVNTKKFTPKEGNNNKEEIIFLCVARLSNEKNHKLLLNAFAHMNNKIPNTTLFIAGEGELKEELVKEANRLNITEKVYFLGNVDDIPSLLRQSDIFILTSIYEGLPMTLLEAMSTRLPVIATNVGGVPDVVKENGILVESGNIDSIVDAMIHLAENPKLRDEMGSKGLEISKNYDVSVVTRKYQDLYYKYSN